MFETTKVAFRDSPIVASELVTFLALNTGFDALDSLTSSNEKLKNGATGLNEDNHWSIQDFSD